jgi:sarcosine oxidase subunit beta
LKVSRSLRLCWLRAELYQDIEKELVHGIEYKHSGGMILIETQEEMQVMQAFVERQRQTGLQVDILAREEAVKLQPGLAEHIVGATYSPQDAEVNPMEVTFAFAKAAKKLGAEVLLETEVTGLTINSSVVEGVITNTSIYS